MTPGTIIAKRQALWCITKPNDSCKDQGITMLVTPPPKFPQPPVTALAVPFIFRQTSYQSMKLCNYKWSADDANSQAEQQESGYNHLPGPPEKQG